MLSSTFFFFHPHFPHSHLQVPSLRLLTLNRLKQTLKVTSAKALKLITLNNLNKDGRTIHQRLREQLQQVAALIVINKNVEPLNGVQVLLELPVALLRLEPL